MSKTVISAITLVVVAIVTKFLWFQADPPCREPASDITEFGKIAFQLLAEMNKYLISLATLLLGALAAVATKSYTLIQASKIKRFRSLILVAGTFAIGSLYFALDSHVGLAEAAINSCTIFGRKLVVSQTLQFVLLVFGLVVSFYLVWRFMDYARSEP